MEEIIKKIENYVNKINSTESYKELTMLKREIANISILDEESYPTNNKNLLLKNFLSKIIVKKELKLKKQDNIKFRSNVFFKKNFCDPIRLENLYKRYQISNKKIGTIPKVFFRKVKNVDKKKTALSLYSILSKYSFELNYYFDFDETMLDKNLILLKREYTLNSLKQELSNVIHQNVNVEYINHGYFGNAFKLIVGKKNFCYKVFFPKFSSNECKNFGPHFEPQIALYTKQNSSKKRFVNFYFGQVTDGLFFDAFMITDFLEESGKKNLYNENNLEFLTMTNSEENKCGNKINGSIVDFGGIYIKMPELENKKLRKYVRVINSVLNCKSNNKIFEYTWEIKKRNYIQLKSFFIRSDKQLFSEAVDILKKYQSNMPNEICLKLKNLGNNHEESLYFVDTIKVRDLIKKNALNVFERADSYSLKIVGRSDVIEGFNKVGRAAIELYNDLIISYLYDENFMIKEIRFEKLVGNKYSPIFKIYSNQIEDIKEEFLYNFINNILASMDELKNLHSD